MTRRTFYPIHEDRLNFHTLISKREHEYSAIDPTQRRVKDGINQVTDALEAKGYTTHPDVVLQGVLQVFNRNNDGSTAITMVFPAHNPAPGDPARADGGPAHGTQFPVPPEIEAKLTHPTTSRWDVYRPAGFDTATGEWVYWNRL